MGFSPKKPQNRVAHTSYLVILDKVIISMRKMSDEEKKHADGSTCQGEGCEHEEHNAAAAPAAEGDAPTDAPAEGSDETPAM